MSGWLPIAELAANVQSRHATAVDQVKSAFSKIAANQDYQAIIAVISERALARAQEIDKRIAAGETIGPLAGVPFIAKDNFLTLGSETTAASNILKGFKAPYQATAIAKLEQAGAICVAKANLDAFAHGSSTENSDFFVTKNPHDKSRVPGGSSGGSTAAVMLDMVPFALGTDTGGSIRLPAAFCGAVGYKPTYGLVSRHGVIAMASSTDVIGPIAKNVADAAYVLNVMAGRDDLDSTTIEADSRGYQLAESNQPASSPKIGVISEYLNEGVDPGVKTVVEAAITKLKAAGYEISEVSLPSLPLALAAYYIICPAEISSNLSRYDGQRFGFSAREAQSLEDSYLLSRSQGFGKEAKRRIMIGTYVLSSGYYDAYYKKAQSLRRKLMTEFDEAFAKVDFLIGPTAPSTAFLIGQNTADPLKMYLTDIMTVAANLTGIPAISLPAGLADELPVGLQLMAAQKHDFELLILAGQVEGLLA